MTKLQIRSEVLPVAVQTRGIHLGRVIHRPVPSLLLRPPVILRRVHVSKLKNNQEEPPPLQAMIFSLPQGVQWFCQMAEVATNLKENYMKIILYIFSTLLLDVTSPSDIAMGLDVTSPI